ncbi:MAG: hypothetical protein ABI295_12360 [Xanthomarina sp.]
MRTDNNKVKNIIISVYYVLFIVTILLVTLLKVFSDGISNAFIINLMLIIGVSVLFLMLYFISKHFEYDSDGVKVEVTNKGLLLSDFFKYREHTAEFHKSQLKDFKIKNYLGYKELVLLIENSQGRFKKERFNVTLVSNKKQKYIKQSLGKMIKENRKSKD